METLLLETLKQEAETLRKELELMEQRTVALQDMLERVLGRIAALAEAQQQAAAVQDVPAQEDKAAVAVCEEANEPEIEVELIVCEDEEEVEEEDAVPEVEAEEDITAPEEPVAEAEETPAQAEEPATAETKEMPQTKEQPAASSASLLPPVDDIRKAVSLGDRFLFQRELFGGDGEKMNKTIDALNRLASLDEALQYVGKKFSWDKDSPAYQLFTTVLKRRFS